MMMDECTIHFYLKDTFVMIISENRTDCKRFKKYPSLQMQNARWMNARFFSI